jgi:hypothetical protein
MDNTAKGDHDYNVAGIGKASDGSEHDNSRGTGIVKIYSPSSLSNGEYLFWGEDQMESSYEFSTASDYMERCSSIWGVSETGDVGTVTISFDASFIDVSNKQTCATLYLSVASDPDFLFKTQYPVTLENGSYTATGVSLSNDSYFTLEYQDLIVVDNSSFIGGAGTSSAPNTSDACYKLLVKSSANGTLNISENAHVREVEIENGGQINIEDGIYLTVDGNIVNNGTMTVTENGSLVQTNTGVNANSGSGTYSVSRSGNTDSYVYNIWSSPITTAALTTVFSDANPCDIWTFEESTQAWKFDYASGYSATCYGNSITFTANDVIAGGDGIMDVTRGYFIPGDLTAQRVYTGEVNNGDYLTAIKTTNLGNPGTSNWRDDDWNLLGNPYPSALSADDFWQENAVNNLRITDALYFWDEADTAGGYNQDADYATWNESGGVASGNTSNRPLGNIASGQGFWVVANQSTSVVFNNSMRANTNNQFFKAQPTDKHNAWFSFTSPDNHKNKILVGYNDHSTDGIDERFDAHKLIGNSPVRFASIINGDEFSIQSVANIPLNSSKVVPLVVFTSEDGTHTFENYDRENIPDGLKIFLRDKFSGIDTDLGLHNYEVTLVANTEYKTRFELVFKNLTPAANNHLVVKDGNNNKPNLASDVTGISEETKSSYSLAFSAQGYSLKNEDGINGTINVMDVTGKSVWNKEVTNNATSVEIKLNQNTAGIYFIEITHNGERLYSNKILKQ